jgi:hypothetical protein
MSTWRPSDFREPDQIVITASRWRRRRHYRHPLGLTDAASELGTEIDADATNQVAAGAIMVAPEPFPTGAWSIARTDYGRAPATFVSAAPAAVLGCPVVALSGRIADFMPIYELCPRWRSDRPAAAEPLATSAA